MSHTFRFIALSGMMMSAGVCAAATLDIDVEKTLHETCRRNLTGSNIALWNQPWELGDEELHDYVRQLKPTYVRIPGGSWANHYIWNGNGIRLGEEEFDLSKLKDGVWDVDYSGYAPGFNIEGDERLPVADNFHGTWHVKQLHDFVETFGAEAIVTVNVGTGTPEMAAEWVRWANKKNDYKVRYWELGNELEGSWELGHILPDGSKMTGEVYAQRFLAFAKAMKAVDPSIKTGGPASSNDRGAFIKEVLRDAGDEVDFISFHSYPVENRVQQERDFYKEIFRMEGAVSKFKGWIKEFQPDRADEIEIAITEWNSKVVEDRVTADLMNGLWCTIWIGEMFRNGISFANQWDMMTATATGGHGLFYFDQFDFEQPGVPQEEMDRLFESFDPDCIPKGQYWALYLWSRYMGDRLVQSELDQADQLYTAVTRSDDALQVMFVNQSRDDVRRVKLESSRVLSKDAVAVRLSHHEYFWDPIARKPKWSREPEPVAVTLSDNWVSVPPFSVLVLQVPFADASNDAVASTVSATPAKPGIELLMQASTPEDVPVEAWVLMPESGPFDPDAEPLVASLKVEGPATIDRTSVRLNEGGGRFYIKPTGTGSIKVTAICGTQTATASLQASPVQSRTEVLWRFEGRDALDGISSDYSIGVSDTAKPNQQTAEVGLEKAVPAAGKGGLIIFNGFPTSLSKGRVGGVAFDARVSHGFKTEDPKARIDVVLQSTADHWIPIGSVPMSDLKDGWKTVELPIKDHAHFESMKWLYSIRLQLSSDRPVTGEVYIDDAGVILR